ncbi:MAG TPA: sulfatase [Myxococcota bacterium]|nr:sulfatase [Myxococcota bacterium]
MSNRLLRARWPWFAAAAVLGLVYLGTLVEFKPADPRPKGSIQDIERLSQRKDLKVLFILVDMLRADRLSAWGYTRNTSPTIDWLASGGVRFARQLSQSSWTKCSMASLWTSLYPQRSGVLRFDQVLSSEAKLPAEILHDAGFRTVGLFRNGWVAANFGFSQGFEVYHQPAPLPLTPNERRGNPSMREPASDASAVEAFRSFLSVSAHERWFVYLHMMDVHQYTYDEKSAIFGTQISDIYDNSVRREDGLIDAVVALLAKAGVLDQTLIVFSADHGEAFNERGIEGHARNVFQEVTEVPFVIAFPFRLEPGLVIRTRTENVDVWPTVLDLLKLPPLQPSDGRSLVPQILAAARGETPPSDGANAFAQIDQTWGQHDQTPAPMVAVASGDFRYVLSTRGGRSEELFDHRSDPLETTDVRDKNPEVTERLRAAALEYLERKPPWSERPRDLDLDEMEKGQLRALGYGLP